VPGNKNLKYLGFIFILGLAILLRIPELNRPLWDDEIISLRTLPVNLFHNPLFFGVTSNLPLFFYLLKIWTLVFNPGVVWQIRLLPLVLSLATLLFWFQVLRKNFGYPVAFIFGILYSVTPLQVYYSTELRPYILAQFLLSMQTVSFYYYIKKRMHKYLIYLMGLSVLCVFTHYCSYFYLFSQGLIAGLIFLVYVSKSKKTVDLKPERNLLLCYFLLALLSFSIYRAILGNPNFTRSVTELSVSSDLSLSSVSKDLSRIKEVFTMYYWYGLYYYYVDWPIQYVIKKILFVVFISTLLLFFVKNDEHVRSFVRWVYPAMLLTLATTLLLENFGYYPFGGRHIMPFSVFYYVMVSLMFYKAIKISKYFSVILVLFVILFIFFNLNLPCANYLNLININEKVGIYRDCLLKI
jgi:hypothetical protein